MFPQESINFFGAFVLIAFLIISMMVMIDKFTEIIKKWKLVNRENVNFTEEKYNYFEIGDRCHVILEMMDKFLILHPRMTEENREKLELAQREIFSVSQWAFNQMDDLEEQEEKQERE